MRCINWRSAELAAVALGLTAMLQGGAIAQSSTRVEVIDDSVTGKALLGRFDYVGKWQHVRGKHDGRSSGTSTRSTQTGDVVILGFAGTRVRLYGVVGPSGGRAGIALDGVSIGSTPVDFYAPRLQTHALFYESPELRDGVHTVSVVVWGTRNFRGRFYYVNIDGAEVDH